MVPDPVLRLSALFCAIAQSSSPDHGKKSEKAAKSIMVRLRFSKTMIQQVVQLVQEQEVIADYHSSWSDGDLRRIVRRVGTELMAALLALRRAGLLTSWRHGRQQLLLLDEIQGRMKEVMKTALVRGPQDLAIDGAKVMEATGLSPGPEVGRIVKLLCEELMDHPEWNTCKRLLAMVKKMKPSALPDHPEGVGEIHGAAGRLKTRAQPKS